MRKPTITLACCLAVAMTYLFSACGGRDDNDHDHDHDHEHHDSMDHDHGHDHDHDHVFACPMHPEITGHEGDKCSICGMPLEHIGHTPEGSYRIDVSTDPQPLAAAANGSLFFRPVDALNESRLVPLEETHEKKMHLIIVSRDLSYFDHVHPEYDGRAYEVRMASSGQTVVPGMSETVFEYGGDYVLFVNYKPANASPQNERVELRVSGKPRPKVDLGAQRLKWERDGYSVTLSRKTALTSGKLLKIIAEFSRDGKPLTDMEHYLGALAHVVIISEDTEEFVHAHPQQHAGTGPMLWIGTSFPKTGKYKMFVQFQHGGMVNGADFVLEVA